MKGNQAITQYYEHQALMQWYFRNPEAISKKLEMKDLSPKDQEEIRASATLMQCNGFRRCG